MKDDGIDGLTLPLLNDQELSSYLPKRGDRLAAINYAKSPPSSEKQSLLERLRVKFNSPKDKSTEKCKLATNATKPNRTIEIGWLHYDTVSDTYKQVRAKTGGGTRILKMDKASRNEDILKECQTRFFPDGKSQKGTVTQFTFEICDFQQQPVPNATLSELYANSGMRTLRFYMKTKFIDDSLKCLPNNNPKRPKMERYYITGNHLTRNETNESSESTIGSSASSPPLSNVWTDFPFQPRYADGEVSFGPVNDLGEITQNDIHVIEEDTLPDIESGIYVIEEGNLPDIESGIHVTEEDTLPDTESVIHVLEEDNLPDIARRRPRISLNPAPKTVYVRRGTCLKDLLASFKDLKANTPLILKRVLDNGKMEMGEGTGVAIDCLVEFWTEFYESCTIGLDEKIPFLRHDYKESEWKACGGIFLYGFINFKYIPAKLSSDFIKASMGLPTTSLMESYLRYLCHDERDTIKKALVDFSGFKDELLDVLDNHQCKKMPTKENLTEIIEEIAHKEMIQEPMFVIDCWKEEIANSKASLQHLTDETLTNLYKESIPTSRRILKRFVVNAVSNSQEETASFLQRYVREIERPMLEKFLRFCTGSDLLVEANKHIYVEFAGMSDFTKRPTARTCTQTLTLPEKYNNYPEFRAEFNNVLKSNVWVFDWV